jgi:ankyrin repeat protein
MEISLEQARRRAKELLRAARAGDEEALGRLRADRERPRLADAQRVIAAGLGFASWPALVAHVETTQGDRAQRRARLLDFALATGGVARPRWDRAQALLEHDPSLARGSLAVALVIGDAVAVAAALDADPEALERDVEPTGKRPLLCATHSAYLAPASPRAGDVLGVVAHLLDRGADPNATFANEYGDMSALYGAAGVVHNPDATGLLLDRGADPDDGESVYHAVEARDTTCLRLLLDHGATVRDTNALGNAIRAPEKVRLLLEAGDLRPQDDELRVRLLHAREDAVARLLIAHGADVSIRDEDGLTPYDRAARFADAALMAILEASGGRPAEPDAVAAWIGAVLDGRPHAATPPGPLRRSDRELLPTMASGGADARVARLLDAGVPIDSPGLEGAAIHYACMWGRPSTLRLLLDRGADPEQLTELGRPLGYVAWGSGALDPEGERADGYLECAEILLALGVPVQQGFVDMASDEVGALIEARLAS